MDTSFTNSDNKVKHWIDKSFDETKWATNLEWSKSIIKHSSLWEKEVEELYQTLLSKISIDKKDKASEIQSLWQEKFQLEKEFIYSFPNLKMRIGNEGYIQLGLLFMNKLRSRAFELDGILNLVG